MGGSGQVIADSGPGKVADVQVDHEKSSKGGSGDDEAPKVVVKLVLVWVEKEGETVESSPPAKVRESILEHALAMPEMALKCVVQHL